VAPFRVEKLALGDVPETEPTLSDLDLKLRRLPADDVPELRVGD
jgi:hypothetical protein